MILNELLKGKIRKNISVVTENGLIFRKEIFAVNLSDIDARFEAGTVTIDDLKGVGLVPRRCECIKVLGGGELTKKFIVKAGTFSASAKEKIEKQGGRAELTNG